MSAPMSPQDFARIVREAGDEELAAGIAANRELILGQLFAQMPDFVDGEAAGDLEAVVEWRIGDRPDGGHDRFQIRIAERRATVERDGDAEPAVVYEVGAVDFVRLCADPRLGPQLFLFGRLRVEGDLVLAAQMPGVFRAPSG